MKNLIAILLTLHASLFTLHAVAQWGSSCLPEGITFETQAQIDSFQTNYPNCTEIEGSVNILGDSITNLNGLNVLTSIKGDLYIYYPWESNQGSNRNLTSLEGLENILSIGGSVTLYRPALTNLVGLDNLSDIGEDLIIRWGTLINFNGIDNLESIGGDLRIEISDDLKSLSGLWNLSSIGGSLKISRCSDLNSLSALENLNFIGEDLYIYNNNDLPNLEGLENITHIGRNLEFHSNGNKLNTLTGLNNLTSTGGDLIIRGNSGLLNLEGLDLLNNVGGDFMITSNNHMTSLLGVENLDTVGGNLAIMGVGKLSSLEGLENINLIEGELKISGNDSLTSIAELLSIDAASISDLYICGNNALSECNVQYVCDYLASPNGSINIYNNGVGCNTPLEVADSCNIELECLPNGNYYFINQESIDSFQDMYPACTDLMGSVTISGSNITNLSGLNNITSIEEDLSIWQNDSLLNLTGLENLSSIGGSLSLAYFIIVGQAWIIGNQNLNSLNGLEGLNKIGGNLFIGGSPYLNDLNGLNKLDSICGDFEIAGSNGLLNLSGLEQLKKIKGSLRFGLNITGAEGEVHGNHLLNDISALNNINHVGGEILIWGNPALTSLTGLNNIEAASITGDLRILSNISLSTCHVNSVCNYLASPGGVVEINYNAVGCNSPEEVVEACGFGVEESAVSSQRSAVRVYPNPTSGATCYGLRVTGSQHVTIKIYDLFGREMATVMDEVMPPGEHVVRFDAGALPAGIYFCVFNTSFGIEPVKMIKL